MDFSQVSKIRLEGKPYDAEVEYLESTGTQWIDTGIAGSGQGYLAVRFQPLPVSDTTIYWRYFGASTGSNATTRTIGVWQANPERLAVGFDNGYSASYLGPIGPVYTIDKTQYQVPTGHNGNFLIFTYNNATNMGPMRLYSFKLWNSNDQLIRDFIPVRKNGIGYLFDKVSGQLFGNQGTGVFLYGSDVRCYSVAKIEKDTLPGKPYDHRVEYIESSGTQWIDTGVLPAGATILIDSVVRSDFATTQVIVGCGGGGGNWFGNVNGYYGVATNKTCGSSSIRSLIRVEYLSGLIQATNVTTGETCQMPTGTLADRNIGLFASSVPSYFANVRIFSARILVSGTIVRDFIPIRKNGVGCLYDQVSKTLFQNAGTGTFTYGSDVPEVLWKKRPYDAEVEWLESTGTQYIDTGLNYFPEYEIGAVVPGAVANNTLGIDQSWKLGRHSAAEPVWRASIDNVSYPTTVSCGTYADMSYHGTTFRCNSDTLTVPPNQYVEGTMVLFSTGVALPSAYPLKLYYCRLFDQNGILVRDFIPVRLGQVGYIYDKVSGQLFGNAGTGSFVYGADLEG